MKRSGVIHGDIKPDNLLVFGTTSDGVNLRLADFGFSSLFASKITITGTRGWLAPEWHHRHFTTDVVGAKKMEMYTYGLLCHWLLFDAVQNSENLNYDPNVETPLSSARRLTSEEAGLDDQQRRQLLRLFEETLVEDRDVRSSEFGKIIEILLPDEYDILLSPPTVHVHKL